MGTTRSLETLPIPAVDDVLETIKREYSIFQTWLALALSPNWIKRSSGINAAPEKYQHIITQSMAGLNGVANIADDLVVHGGGIERNMTRI